VAGLFGLLYSGLNGSFIGSFLSARKHIDIQNSFQELSNVVF